MRKLKIILLEVFLLVVSSMMYGQDKVCNPDQSIENQKAKIISTDARALLLKVMHDKATFAWPVRVCDCWLSSLYGPRKSEHHNGIDLAAPKGTAVNASADGVVEIVQKSVDKNGYGNMVLLDHKELGYKTRYAHLDVVLVDEKQIVQKGQKIGTVGSTGHVVAKNTKGDPSHLHFEIYRGQQRVNPLIALFATDPVWVKAQS